jgi:hypothetical protein
MDAERAETYLRRLAETEFRRALAGADLTNPAIARIVQQVGWAGEILVAADVLTDEAVNRTVAELEAALIARSSLDPHGMARRLSWILGRLASDPTGPSPPYQRTAQPIRVTPVGRTLGIVNDRAPSDLHLMTLAHTPSSVAITVAMRMRWPPDGSSADLEITGAGPQHLPYDHLWAVDDQGTRYRLTMAGEGGAATWRGTIWLSPAPPRGTRWLDLIADGTRPLIRLDLVAHTPRARPAHGVRTEASPAVPGGERLLAVQAERILASAWDSREPAADQRLGEMITVLTEAGAIAADSPTPGHLAALCQRLGAEEGRITALPATEIPAPWASVLAQPDAEPTEQDREWFAPLGVILPDIGGTRFALAGLSTAAGESHLHVIGGGTPVPSPGRGPGLSWWIRDGAGNWHVATEADPDARSADEPAFRLRLAPPLGSCPDTIEVVVTGSVTRVAAVVPVRDGHGMPDT